MFDVTVIGGGVIGGAVLRELTKYNLSVCLLEKENDVCMGASKANSGIVHAGYDAPVGTLKARFNVAGNEMMAEYAQTLGVRYRNNGSLVVAFSKEEQETLLALKERGKRNGVKSLRLVDRAELRALEPNLSEEAIAALYAPTGGIVCPYTLTVAAIGNAMDNGAMLYRNFLLSRVEREGKTFRLYSSEGGMVATKLVINCAGIGAEGVARLFGDRDIKLGARRGEYLLLDRESGDFGAHTLFRTPTRAGKGILVTQTVDGNILLGPTAEEVDGVDTTAEGMEKIMRKAKETYPLLPLQNVITSFAGVRAFSSRRDFILEESKFVEGLIHCVGIESPGLTAAPAIAKFVVEELLARSLPLEKNPRFQGERKPNDFFKNLSVAEQNNLIQRIPAYGKVVCRCEQVTEGEIVEAIRRNPSATDIDGVKRRVRAGMGRCQGGFCQPQIAEILARELGIPLQEVTKKGKGSHLITGVTKE